jgi:hypothetical protein
VPPARAWLAGQSGLSIRPTPGMMGKQGTDMADLLAVRSLRPGRSKILSSFQQRGRSMNPRRDPWLITRLFDLSFRRFVALSLARILYVLLMIAGLMLFALLVLYLFQIGEYTGAILVLVFSPVLYFVYLLVIRLVCETLVVVFAMVEHLQEIREDLEQLASRQQSSSPS